VLAQPADVDRVLRAALALDAFNARALRALLRRIAAEPADRDDTATRARRREMASLLDRLADVEKEPEQKTSILLELAEVHVRLGDMASAERALVEAVARSPAHARAFTRLASLFRRAERTDHVGHARALAAVVAMGQQIGHLDARWFATLGQIEIHNLSRSRDGIAHLQRAVALDPTLYETRFELATAYTHAGANDEATRVLVAMLAPNPPSPTPMLSIADPAAGVALLEKTLTGERRPDEAIVAGELRAIAGELDDARRSWLRARRLPHTEGAPGALNRQVLVTHVLPAEGRHILLEVAAAISGVEAKLLRGDLGELGLSPRDRVGPRAGHPTRALLDRVARQMGVEETELAISSRATKVRVLAQDVPWVVVPASFVQRDESAQLAGLARIMARIAYGTPWREELTPEAAQALLVAGARQVVPKYGPVDGDAASAKLVAQHEATLSRVLSRRQRKLLEELAPHITSAQARLPPAAEFADALARAELRAAFVVTGDLLTTVGEVRTFDAALDREAGSPGGGALAAVLDHPLAGDVARFALTAEATALRRRLGSIWVR
ncbi:MAG TPA: hypothetical protein VKU41_22355, partial [Polyangiaceae bacterium]|nr:hypothetical protein [Polyangiaceae bacterium]